LLFGGGIFLTGNGGTRFRRGRLCACQWRVASDQHQDCAGPHECRNRCNVLAPLHCPRALMTTISWHHSRACCRDQL